MDLIVLSEYYSLVTVISRTHCARRQCSQRGPYEFQNTTTVRFPDKDSNTNFLETGEFLLLLHAVTFIVGFVMVNSSFIPRDDTIQEVLSFTVVNLQVKGENVMQEHLRFLHGLLSFSSLLLKRREL